MICSCPAVHATGTVKGTNELVKPVSSLKQVSNSNLQLAGKLLQFVKMVQLIAGKNRVPCQLLSCILLHTLQLFVTVARREVVMYVETKYDDEASWRGDGVGALRERWAQICCPYGMV